MSTVPFIRNFFGAKGHDAARSVVTALVRLDPEAASRADLATMEQDLDRAGEVIAKLRTELSKEHGAFDKINERYHDLMGAAETMQRRIADPVTASDKVTSLQASLTAVLGQIEIMAPELDRDKQDVDSTTSLLADAEKAYQEKAAALRGAKQNLDAARHDLQHASIEEERAKSRAAAASVVAGLSSSPTGLSVALNVMHEEATAARERASSATMKISALASAGGVDVDANIADALSESKGAPGESSLSDRLNALKR